MLGPDHRITFRRDGEDVRVDPGDVKVLGMKEVSLLASFCYPSHRTDNSWQASNGRVVYLDGTVQY